MTEFKPFISTRADALEEKILAELELEEKETPDGNKKIIESQESDIEKFELETEDVEKIKELMDQVDKSRGTYARKDYEVTNVWARIKKVLGEKNLHFKKDDEQATLSAYNQYKTTLQELLNYQIEKLKKNNLSSEEQKVEIEKLIKYYNQEEKANLCGAQDEAKAEAWEKNRFGKAGNRMKIGSEKYFNWYKKIGWKKKVGIGAVASVFGVGFITRIAGGAVAGSGLTKGLNERYRKKEDTRLEKKRTDIIKDVEVTNNPEEKFEVLMQKMQAEIDNYQNNFRTEKAKARNRKIAGATLGIILGSGALAEIVKFIGNIEIVQEKLHEYGVNEYISKTKEFAGEVKEKYFPKDAAYIDHPNARMPVSDQSVSEASPVTPNTEAKIISAKPEVTSESPLGQSPVQEIPKNIELTIEKGSSFQGAIIKQLMENGIGKEEAGKMAHKMYMEYIKIYPDPSGHDYSLVHSGAKIELSPDGKSIVGFEDSPKSQWAQKFEGKVNMEHDPEISEIPATGELTEHHHTINPTPDESNLAKVDVIEKESTSQGLGESGVGMAASAASTGAVLEAKRRKNNVISLAEKKAEKAEKEKRKVEKKLDKEKIKIEDKYKFEKDDEFEHRALKCIKAISLSQENWRFMSKFKFSELKRELSPKLLKNVNNFEKDTVVLLGEHMRHQEGETVQRWLARVVAESLEKDEISEVPFKMAA